MTLNYKVTFYPRSVNDIQLANKLNMQLEYCKIYNETSAVLTVTSLIDLCGMFRNELKEIETIKGINDGKLIYAKKVFYIERKTINNEQN
jgi:hypothetical protein